MSVGYFSAFKLPNSWKAQPYEPPVIPKGPARYAIEMDSVCRQMICICGAPGSAGYINVHLPDCEFTLNNGALSAGSTCAQKPQHKPVLYAAPGVAWVKPANSKALAKHRTPTSPKYRLTLQFYFTRPVDYALWKKIKAPKGWRKGPIPKDARNNWCGVRFLCTSLKYALSPEEVETLQASLYMCLMESYQ